MIPVLFSLLLIVTFIATILFVKNIELRETINDLLAEKDNDDDDWFGI